MNITVLGASGLLGNAVALQMAALGHRVTRAGRHACDVAVDFRYDDQVDALRSVVRGADIVINTIGILIERDGNHFDTVHHQAVAALAGACEKERVARLVHVSALGVGTGIAGSYMASKLAGELALTQYSVDYAIVRPSLLVDPNCPSTRLFRWLASLPVQVLPGLLHPGASIVAPMAVSDVALCIAHIAEHPKALRRYIELGGAPMRYRDMLAHYRREQGRGPVLRIPMPWWLMKATAWLAPRLPQNVFSIDTVRMLQANSIPHKDETARWLGHSPSPITALQCNA